MTSCVASVVENTKEHFDAPALFLPERRPCVRACVCVPVCQGVYVWRCRLALLHRMHEALRRLAEVRQRCLRSLESRTVGGRHSTALQGQLNLLYEQVCSKTTLI